MAWVYLVVAGVFEIGWPLGLKLGWTEQGVRPWPLAMSIACMLISGGLLLIAQRTLPMGTAYAVWTGIGVIGTFVVGLLYLSEPATSARFVCIGLIAVGIVGLKFFGNPSID
ncbi:MAG: multidrug efflux SMR transporter [Planctomycetaceae bacterium]|nr:multidrug efflux SMR transporter [Planctomycetales bacterium]MCB9923157.1 multidrug efflux SMR transporter [Planctomycetaceae bacterium]